MWTHSVDLLKPLKDQPWANGLTATEGVWEKFTRWVEEHLLTDFLGQVSQQVDEIVEIDPDLSEREILETATRHMVDYLWARSASVRIYDPLTAQMLSYGSYPFEEGRRQTYIPLDGSVAGEVVKSRRPCLVPDILREDRYQDKEVIKRKGVHSLMAVPLEIPRFFPHERDTVGVIQIYFPEKDRQFSALEIHVATLMARRLSFVIARKKILSMHRVKERQDAIVRHIFKRLGRRGGIKVKEAFNSVIPELADMVSLQSCALFSFTRDFRHVVLEAGYPEAEGYHSIGKVFPVESEPAFGLLQNLEKADQESPYDIVTPSYILVVDPQRSSLISNNLKRFAQYHSINSILYVPLEIDGEITYFMTFDALDQRQRYREDEIEVFLLLGRELIKAHRMEQLDDILHDFKNPAIATAGFSRRLKQLLEKGAFEANKEQILRYVDILFEETSRLQELALSIYHVGSKEVVDLVRTLRRRFDINREAIREQLKQNITLKEGPFDPDLKVCCYSMHIERVLDNLLNNATKAVPLKGGFLSIRAFADGDWACAEISNSGQLSEEDRMRLLAGEGEGRGLYITHRIMRLLKGRIEIQTGKGTTTFLIRIPLYRGSDGDCR